MPLKKEAFQHAAEETDGTIAAVAAFLDITPRYARRKLKDLGISHTLAARVRYQEYMDALSQTDGTAKAVARYLGLDRTSVYQYAKRNDITFTPDI
jgi:DNA-binding NtrC family response regulator